MINFREPQFLVPSVLMILSIVILAGTLLFMILMPPPSVAGIARGKSANLQEMKKEIQSAKVLIAQNHKKIMPMVWTGNADTVSGTVLEQLTAEARQRALNISAFRPQRTQDVGGVTELPYTVQLSGAYQGIHAVMSSLDAPSSKVVLRSVQIASSATGTGVTATLGLSTYVLSDPALAVPPKANPVKAGTRTHA